MTAESSNISKKTHLDSQQSNIQETLTYLFQMMSMDENFMSTNSSTALLLFHYRKNLCPKILSVQP